MTQTTGTPAGYLQEALASTMGFEGSVPWMYLDSPGLVTVGIGRMLPNAAAAQALPFQSPHGGPATLLQIAQDFNRVKSMKPNQSAGFYRAATSVKLLSADIQALFLSVITSVDGELKRMFPRYPSWPVSARLAAIDMLYNLGSARFRAYAHMLSALDQQDFLTAAKECARNAKDPSFAARNLWTRTSFLDAEQEAQASA